MSNEYFKKSIEIEPSLGLRQKILDNINIRECRRAKINLTLSFLGFIVSFFAIFPTFIYLGKSLYNTGFSQYLSAMFSDGGVVFTYWRDYISLVVESAPVFEILSVLVVIFVLLLSLKSAIKNIKPALFNNLTI